MYHFIYELILIWVFPSNMKIFYWYLYHMQIYAHYYANLQGRNEFAINVITEELRYLTWEEAFLCLSNENLPDQLRAKYCSLMIGQLFA